MIRLSEMVLAGHPDKFCDQVADAIVAESMRRDPEAYCQVEVAAWCGKVFLTGGVTMGEEPFRTDDLVNDVAARIGYGKTFDVHCDVCFDRSEPRQWTRKVNDQSIVVGWAGYDARTAYLPPEHHLAHRFREALESATRGTAPHPAFGHLLPASGEKALANQVIASCHSPLAAQGPDGKVLVRIREEGPRWTLEHLLVTLQHREETRFEDLVAGVNEVLESAWNEAKGDDPRWRGGWEDVQLLINPNGPLVNGGTDGDNGQTGRKLVMDFYGPRVPLGGGALSGKHLSHIDRCGSYAAREAAVHAVRSGAKECRVVLAYAPNEPVPLEVIYEMEGRGERMPREFFHHDAMRDRYAAVRIAESIARGTHFLDPALPWNRGSAGALDAASERRDKLT